VRQLVGLPPEVLLITLAGHSCGHSAVAVFEEDAPGAPRWWLHAGDAYTYHEEISPDAFRGHPLLSLLTQLTEVNRSLRIGNHARLRELVRFHGDEVTRLLSPRPVGACRDPGGTS
jgi:hypothetical protein